VSHLDALGWSPFFANFIPPASDLRPARVVEQQRALYRLRAEAGEFQAVPTGRVRHSVAQQADLPVVGDWVLVDAAGNIHAVLPRRSSFSRKAAGAKTTEQVLAANVDIAFVVTSLNADLNLRRIERYMALIWDSGAQPVILLSKADLSNGITAAVDAVAEAAPAVPVHPISVVTDAGLDSIHTHLHAARTAVLLGSSGVGKSTLINHLLGHPVQKIAGIGEDDRGRHTTTARRLFIMPSGGMVIDTPGIRELQLWGSAGGIRASFEDIEQVAAGCRFRNCGHDTEPHCAVRLALDEGRLDADRFESYLKLRRELDYLARKQDVLARVEENKRWKRLHKAAREQYKLKRRE
jgi:ribosome biogenesis GTPase / thiamine phosphate phosphatase